MLRTYAIPGALAAATISGLVLALVLDGAADVLALVLVVAPLVVLARSALPKPKRITS